MRVLLIACCMVHHVILYTSFPIGTGVDDTWQMPIQFLSLQLHLLFPTLKNQTNPCQFCHSSKSKGCVDLAGVCLLLDLLSLRYHQTFPYSFSDIWASQVADRTARWHSLPKKEKKFRNLFVYKSANSARWLTTCENRIPVKLIGLNHRAG